MNRRQKNLVSTLVSVGLALLCYFLVLAVSHDHQTSFDLTAEKRFSFSQQTKDIVSNLKVPVKLYAFVDPNGDGSQIASMLERYRRLNSKEFRFEIVDLEKKPTLAESLEVRAYGQGVLERVEEGASSETPPRRERVMSFDEATLTNALLKLTTTTTKKIVYLTGHGEREPKGGDKESVSSLAAALMTEGYLSETVKLAEDKVLPQNMDLLVLAGPTSPMLEGERKVIDAYLQKGGKMLFLADITTPQSYAEWLKPYGFLLGDSVIIDTASNMAGAEPVFAIGVAYSGKHPITRNFADVTAFRLGRPVQIGPADPLDGGGPPELEVLVQTAKSAFLLPIKDVLKSSEVSFSPKDQEPASHSLAVAGLYPRGASAAQPTPSPTPSEAKADEVKEISARIVVVGNVDAFTDRLFGYVSNRDFVLNTVNWLSLSENQITVRTKDHKSQPLMLDKQKEKWLNFIFCLLLPFLSMLTGALIALQRRRGLAS